MFSVLPINKLLGAFTYSVDDYLNLINLSKEMLTVGMVNASELIDFEASIHTGIYRV